MFHESTGNEGIIFNEFFVLAQLCKIAKENKLFKRPNVYLYQSYSSIERSRRKKIMQMRL